MVLLWTTTAKNSFKYRDIDTGMLFHNQFLVSEENLKSLVFCTYLIRPHRHASHNHGVHPHLAHVSPSSTGRHAPIHHHASILPRIPLLPKLLLAQRRLRTKLLLRV